MKNFIFCLLLISTVPANLLAQNLEKNIQKPVVRPIDNNKIIPVKLVTRPKVCVDKIFDSPGVQESRPGVAIDGLVGLSDRFWPNGSTLTVKFLGGSSFVRNKTMQYANQWSNYVNIRFRFINDGKADINVRFNSDGTSWSMIGTDVKNLEALRRLGEFFAGDIATVNFGWFDDTTPDEEFSRVVLHEFGHVLGFVHEQSHPDASIPWDREAVYRYFSGPPNNWSRDKIDREVLSKYNRMQTQFSNYDASSIMQYPVDNSLTIGDFAIGWNTRLSQTDKDFSRIIYPSSTARVNKLRVTFKTADDDLRVNSQAKLVILLNSGAVTKLEVSANRGAPYANGSTNTGEVNMPPGINLSNIVKCDLYFDSGKQFDWDNVDTWKVDEVKLEWVEAGRANIVLSTVRGTPKIVMTQGSDLLLYPRS